MANASVQTTTVVKQIEVEEREVTLTLSEKEAEMLWLLLGFHVPAGVAGTNTDVLPIFNALDLVMPNPLGSRSRSPWNGMLTLDNNSVRKVN